MARATSAVLASVDAAKLVVEWVNTAFAINASIENEWLLSTWTRLDSLWTHAATAYAFGSPLA